MLVADVRDSLKSYSVSADNLLSNLLCDVRYRVSGCTGTEYHPVITYTACHVIMQV